MIILDTKWILCHNGRNIFHYVFVEKGQSMETGQPIVEMFNTKEELLARILEINPEYNLEIE